MMRGCQWSGVATMQISGFSWSSNSRKSLYDFGSSPVSFFTRPVVRSRKRASTSHNAPILHSPEAMASPRMLLPHHPQPISAVRYFLARSSAPKSGMAENTRLAAADFWIKPRRLIFTAPGDRTFMAWMRQRSAHCKFCPAHSCLFVFIRVPLSQQILIHQKQPAKIVHHPHRVFAFRNFSQEKSVETNLVQSRKQSAERIFLQIQVAHVDGGDFVFHQVEIVVETLAGEIGLIRVPADPDIPVIGRVHDGFDVRQQRCFRAVHFEPDLHAVTFAELAQFAQRLADLLECFFLRNC